MTIWEWMAVVKGHNAAHGGEPEAKAPTPEEHEERVRRLTGGD